MPDYGILVTLREILELLIRMNSGNTESFKVMCAPVQGFTESPFRHYHSMLYGCPEVPLTYFTPFLRMERGEVRRRDLRELSSELNDGHDLVPQIIFRGTEEFVKLTAIVRDAGFGAVDLNLGCPFPPQVNKGRGAGMLADPMRLQEVCRAMEQFPDMKFSAKMRLGVSSPDEWGEALRILGDAPLTHITLHPRTAAQVYGGELHPAEALRFIHASAHSVIFNGDILTPEAIDKVRADYPGIAGVMIGRGLLIRPSLVAEWSGGEEWSVARRRSRLLELHDRIFTHLSETLTGGDTQILMKVKPLWEYFGAEFDRKQTKKIKKAGTLQRYRQAIAELI